MDQEDGIPQALRISARCPLSVHLSSISFDRFRKVVHRSLARDQAGKGHGDDAPKRKLFCSATSFYYVPKELHRARLLCNGWVPRFCKARAVSTPVLHAGLGREQDTLRRVVPSRRMSSDRVASSIIPSRKTKTMARGGPNTDFYPGWWWRGLKSRAQRIDQAFSIISPVSGILLIIPRVYRFVVISQKFAWLLWTPEREGDQSITFLFLFSVFPSDFYFPRIPTPKRFRPQKIPSTLPSTPPPSSILPTNSPTHPPKSKAK